MRFTGIERESDVEPDFYIGSVRISPTNSGYWVYPRTGRGRFCARGGSVAAKIEAGRDLGNLDAARRAFASGTHEPMVYFRTADGKIGIPPDPSMIPTDAIRFEANSLRDIDKVMDEMAIEQRREWTDNGEFTDGLEDVFGGPRQHLVDQLSRSISNRERDVIHVMLKDLDHEASQRQRITSEVRHHLGGY